MPVLAAERSAKSSRMDLRMEPERKSAYEEAARLKGQSLSKWSLSNLDAAASRDIEEARTMRLPGKDFDRFCELLERPAPPEFLKLLAEEPQWAR